MGKRGRRMPEADRALTEGMLAVLEEARDDRRQLFFCVVDAQLSLSLHPTRLHAHDH
jgi:hypothetical protein